MSGDVLTYPPVTSSITVLVAKKLRVLSEKLRVLSEGPMKMPKPAKPVRTQSTRTKPNNSATFDTVVEDALKHFNDPEWLAQNSSLAIPYLLGQHRQNGDYANGFAEQEQGTIIQQIIRDSLEYACSEQDDGERWRKIIELRYLSKSRKSELQIQDALALRRSAYHKHRKRAISALSAALLEKMRPAFHSEAPNPILNLLGRDSELATILPALQALQSVSILGAGGVGKTSLGVALAHQQAPQATFWYTFRPGLNDRLSTLLYHLAHFLHDLGASYLWSQVIANQGEIKAETLNLLRSDFETISDQTVALCFDEVDLLRPTEVESHAQLVPFLHSLQGLVPLLFMGQRSIIETDQRVELTGLPSFLVEQLFQQNQMYFSKEKISQLCEATNGNPRLLTLFIALHQSQKRTDAPVEQIWDLSVQALSMESLLRRLWHHLHEGEMFWLELLAVFRNPVPRSGWSGSEEATALEQLIQWQLVQVDQRDQVALVPTFKEGIYSLLSVDERFALHKTAAQIRLQFGQTTWAAFHFIESDEHQAAFDLWDRHYKQEIDQGQAEAGLSMLQSISRQQLDKDSIEKLDLRLAELHKLLGNYDQSLQQIRKANWHTPFLQVQAKRIAGDIHEERGNTEDAVSAYTDALTITHSRLGESASLHRAIGYLYMREREFEQAKREVLRIRHDAATLEAVIQFWQGEDTEQTKQIYQEALQLAEAAEYPYGIANSQLNLGYIYGWQKELEQAEAYFQKAIDYFEMTGNLYKTASAKSNLAVTYCLSEQFEDAIEPAQESLELFEKLGEEFGIAVGWQTLAEANLGLGDLAQAETFAQQVIDAENIHMQPDGLRVLGEVKLKQGDLEGAERLVQQSIQIAQETENPKLEAYGWRALGEVHLAQAADDSGHTAFQKAIDIFTICGLSGEVEQTQRLMGK